VSDIFKEPAAEKVARRVTWLRTALLPARHQYAPGSAHRYDCHVHIWRVVGEIRKFRRLAEIESEKKP